jgi:hypothetical protein
MATPKFAAGALNAMLDAFETWVGASPVLKMRTGAPPSDAAAADSGIVVATITLDSDWMASAATAIKAFSNMPLTDNAADADGVIGHYRLYKSDGVTVATQGDVTETGGGGAMTVDNATVKSGQQFSVTSWSINLSGNL